MNTPQVTGAILVLLLAGLMVSWKHGGSNTVELEPTPRGETVPEARDQPTRDLAAAFVAEPGSLSDEDYRRAARAYEEQRQAKRAAAKRQARLGSSRAAPYRQWRRRVEKVQELVDAIDEFPEGSIQWHKREELKQLLLEEPRHP